MESAPLVKRWLHRSGLWSSCQTQTQTQTQSQTQSQVPPAGRTTTSCRLWYLGIPVTVTQLWLCLSDCLFCPCIATHWDSLVSVWWIECLHLDAEDRIAGTEQDCGNLSLFYRKSDNCALTLTFCGSTTGPRHFSALPAHLKQLLEWQMFSFSTREKAINSKRYWWTHDRFISFFQGEIICSLFIGEKSVNKEVHEWGGFIKLLSRWN